MSVTEFKSNLGKIASEIGDEPIVVENHGAPRLMVFSAEAGVAMVETAKKQRQMEILRRFEAIQFWNDERNADLSDEDALLRKVMEEVGAYRAGHYDIATDGDNE